MTKMNFILSAVVLGITLSACEKENTPETVTYPYNIRMTDAPGPYDAVFVDIQAVEITGAGGGKVMLDVNKGIYNLLDFSNGKDTLIAGGLLENTKVEQIRLILGPNNAVMVDSVLYPLSTPSAEQSGLKLAVNQTLQAGIMYGVLLDFDANKSIIQTGNGEYKLKPVIRTIEIALTGAIKGSITPVGLQAVVTATSSTNMTYSSNVNEFGQFMLLGIPSGIYTLTLTPAAPFNEITQSNITVSTGILTNVGNFEF